MKRKIVFFIVCCIFFSCKKTNEKDNIKLKTKFEKIKDECNIDNAIDLINNLPEVQKQSKFVDSISHQEKRLSFMSDSTTIAKLNIIL